MPRLNYNVSLVEKTPEQIRDLIYELNQLGIVSMGYGYNNPKCWIVWTQQDLSQLLTNKGFKFIDNQS